MKIGAAISTLLTSLYAVYKATSIVNTLNTSILRVYNGDNVNDTSGNAQNGTNVGSVTFTSGKIGNAFTFNGSNYVNLPNDSLNSLTGDFSISFWVYYTSLVGGQGILSDFTYNGTNSWGIGILTSSNNLFFRINNGTSNVYDLAITGGQAMSQDTWYHYTITRKASTGSKIYRNGVLLVSDTNTVNPVYNSGNIRPAIGVWNYGPLYSNLVAYYMSNNSKIDALTIWNKELTGSEITALYNGASGLEYPFSTAITIDSANDSLGTYNGTAQGGLTYTAGKSGNAFTFNGTNAYVSLPTNTLSSLTDFSISLWCNPSSLLTGGAALVSNATNFGGVDYGYMLYFSYGSLYFRFYRTPIVDLVANLQFTANTWYHIVITRKSSTGTKMYINGSLNASNTSTVNPNYTTTNYNSLGVLQYDSINKVYYYDGKIDEVNIWNKELTATEVTELYNSGTGKFYPY